MFTSKKTSRQLVHVVAIAEFDILKGNTLSYKYPDKVAFPESHPESLVASLCLPDGAHIHQRDATYLVIPSPEAEAARKEGGGKKGKDEGGAPAGAAGGGEYLYGIGCFRNKADSTVTRGAIQKSLLVLSYCPWFHIYEPMARFVIDRFIDAGETTNKSLKLMYEALNSNLTRNLTVSLFDTEFSLAIPNLQPDQFGGISLIDLLRKFREDTMLLWYALLLQQRILVCGQPAQAVGNCVLAAPCLVAPLTGFTHLIAPYVCLEDISPIERPTYICGTTNFLFETRQEWYDVCGSFSTGSIIHQSISKVSGADREFIKSVLGGLDNNHGEGWAREQFKRYTTTFLKNLQDDNLKGQQKKYLSEVRTSDLFLRYLGQKDVTVTEEKNPLEIINAMRADETATEAEKLTAIQIGRLLFELDKLLENLSEIELVCDADGVEIVARYLTFESGQVRKYAASVIAQLAMSVKGQIAILSGEVLPRIIDMLRDPAANVQNAACFCLQRISTLFIGCHSLVDKAVHEILGDIIASEQQTNLVLKVSAVTTLLQIYRYCPSAPKLSPEPFYLQLASPDRSYQQAILQLLDLWECAQPGVPASEKIVQHIRAISTGDAETRTQATSYLLSDLVSDSQLVMELVDGGGVELVLENESLLPASEKLPRVCYAVLTLVADHNVGRKRLLRLKVIERSLAAINNVRDPLYLFYVVRFVEVLCQHSLTTDHLYERGGAETLVNFVMAYSGRYLLNTLCLPALGALKYMVLLSPAIRAEVKETIKPLRSIVVLDGTLDPENAAHDEAMQDLLRVVIRVVDEVDASGTPPAVQAHVLESIRKKHGANIQT